MSRRLLANSRPAERARGCVFAERFRTWDAAVENGTAITAGTIVPGNGRVRINSGGRITYVNGHPLSGASPCTIVTKLRPTALTGNYQLGVVLGAGAANAAWWLGLYNTNVFAGGLYGVSTAYSTVLPNLVDEYVVALAYGGAAQLFYVYVNGVRITGSNQTAAVADSRIDLGLTSAGSYPYVGEIGETLVFNQRLSDEEIAAYSDGSMWSYENRASVALQMRQVDHDAANNRTLDTSGNARHAVWTPGATQPTKLANRHGYDLDGGDYMNFPGTGAYNQPGVSFVLEFEADTAVTGADEAFLDTNGTNRFLIYRASTNVLSFTLNGTAVAAINAATFNPYWRGQGRNVLVFSSTPGGVNRTNIYLNQGRLLQDGGAAWTAADVPLIWIGCNYVTANKLNGRITRLYYYPFALNPMQAEDARIQLALTASER